MLVDFADSSAGRVYARTCEHWGAVPGSEFGDDVMGFNLAVAMRHFAMADAKRQDSKLPGAVRTAEQARAMYG